MIRISIPATKYSTALLGFAHVVNQHCFRGAPKKVISASLFQNHGSAYRRPVVSFPIAQNTTMVCTHSPLNSYDVCKIYLQTLLTPKSSIRRFHLRTASFGKYGPSVHRDSTHSRNLPSISPDDRPRLQRGSLNESRSHPSSKKSRWRKILSTLLKYSAFGFFVMTVTLMMTTSLENQQDPLSSEVMEEQDIYDVRI